jgi:hypothetical protein
LQAGEKVKDALSKLDTLVLLAPLGSDMSINSPLIVVIGHFAARVCPACSD